MLGGKKDYPAFPLDIYNNLNTTIWRTLNTFDTENVVLASAFSDARCAHYVSLVARGETKRTHSRPRTASFQMQITGYGPGQNRRVRNTTNAVQTLSPDSIPAKTFRATRLVFFITASCVTLNTSGYMCRLSTVTDV